MVKKVYVYVVLFATLMMTIGGSVSAIMSISDIVNPAPYYQSFDEYKNVTKQPPAPESATNKGQTLSDAQLQQNYDRMVAQQKTAARQRAVNSLIKSLAWVVIPLPLFIYFQRKVLKSEE